VEEVYVQRKFDMYFYEFTFWRVNFQIANYIYWYVDIP